MKIDERQVQYVSKLARISLSEEEIKEYAMQLENILEFIDKLNELNVESVEPTATILDLTNVMREDNVKKEFSVDEVLSNSPEREEDFFVVPQVIK